MSTGRFWIDQDLIHASPIKFRCVCIRLDTTQFLYRRKPIHRRYDLIANLALGNPCRIANDGWHTNTAFEECAFVADPFSCVPTATMREVIMTARITATVVVNCDPFSIFDAMSIIARHDDDRVVPKTCRFQFFHHSADVVINR